VSLLPESIRKLGEEIAAYYSNGHPAETPPYIVYVYSPKDEFRVRRELGDLKAWLGARGVGCLSVSLADLFWQAVEESGYRDQIFAEEERARSDPGHLDLVNTSLGQILSGPPSLADRVLGLLADEPQRSATFLYRAGALYPVYRTSALLDDLRERLAMPVVLLYPGRLVGQYGLSFMGRCEPAHGYRAKIVAREPQ